MPRDGWRALIEDERRSAADRAIDSILSDLRSSEDLWSSFLVHLEPADHPRARSTLQHGAAGLLLLDNYLMRSREGLHELEQVHLGHALTSLAEDKLPPWLFEGVAGIGWALAHRSLVGNGQDFDLSELDALLLRYVQSAGNSVHFELISGRVGVGLYFLERLPAAQAREGAEWVVASLAESVEEHPDGLCWRTPAEWLEPKAGRAFPEGIFNLGVSHGIPGVLGFLGRCLAEGVAVEECRRLLSGVVPWLLARRHPPEAPRTFPYFYTGKGQIEDARLAWCYGEVGIAAVLIRAGLAAGAEEWIDAGRDIALRAASIPFRESGIDDASLCHGAAGLLHQFNRMGQALGEDRLLDAARSWFDQTLAFYQPGTGIGGFDYLHGYSRAERFSIPGLLIGSAGVGLALHAAIEAGVEPNWDRIFLVDLPPGTRFDAQ